MKIAALSDIHGNLFALDTALADAERRGVDVIVNLGDILSGPLLPRETADRLMALRLPTISGNHERQVLGMRPDEMGASDRYAFEQISLAQRQWLSVLPGVLAIDDVFLCHATPHSDVDCYLEDIVGGELIAAPLRSIEARTGDCDASLIFCGHSHIPRLAHLSTGQIIVNPGSVGIQAYFGHHPIPHTVEMGSPHARYAIAERSRGAWCIDFVAVPYDWEMAAKLAEQRGRHDWAQALRSGFVRNR
jgi:putative phosphoesterase